MMKHILVVCTGNICRSPTGEYCLKKELGPDFEVMSAGLGALVDHPAHELSQKIALEHGIDMSAHRARQINLDILKWADLILVMENGAVSAMGRHEELMQSSDIYREIYEQQTKGGGDNE